MLLSPCLLPSIFIDKPMTKMDILAKTNMPMCSLPEQVQEIVIMSPKLVTKIIKDVFKSQNYHAFLHKERPKHHGHKGDPRVTPGTSLAAAKRAQVILV